MNKIISITFILLFFNPIYSQSILKCNVIHDDDNGKAVEGVSVLLLNNNQSIITEFDGSFQFDIKGIPQQYLSLQVDKPGWKVTSPNTEKGGIIKIKKSTLKHSAVIIKLIKKDSIYTPYTKEEEFNFISEQTIDNSNQYFALQLLANKNRLTANTINSIEDKSGYQVKELYQDNVYHYILGDFTSRDDAAGHREELAKKNIDIVTYTHIVRVYRNPLTPYYRIQIASGTKLEPKAKIKSNNTKLKKYGLSIIVDENKSTKNSQSVTYKYILSSKYLNFEDAMKDIKKIKKLGFKGAYPVRYRLKETRVQ